MKCFVNGCVNSIKAQGLCNMHYKRAMRGSDLSRPAREPMILPKTHPVYVAWTNMKTRCDNPNSTQYKWYGARGIHYCDRWKEFKNFYADMFFDWHEGLMLDREENDGDYTPFNCRWVPPGVSARNRRERGTCSMARHTEEKEGA